MMQRSPARRADLAGAPRVRRLAFVFLGLAAACAPASGEREAGQGAAAAEAAAFAAMDGVYDRFTRAYRLGAPDSVLALYTDEPLYLPGQGPIVQGREALRDQFGFLSSIRADSGVAHISFESVGRGADGDLGWDVGYYTLRVERPGGVMSPPSRGKFTTVWRRGPDGVWRIHVDGFSPAPPAERSGEAASGS